MGQFPTGVVAITAIDVDGAPVGMTVGSFTSVSLDPALVGFFPARSSTSFPRIHAAGRFCVNVLSRPQEPLCRAMSAVGTDRFAGVLWTRSPVTGSPAIEGALAWIDCVINAIHEAGDHHIVVGRVVAFDVVTAGEPLVFFRGGYGGFTGPAA
jgi:flavin reductase (DIM6/NTAB) family NADH-FMN oxidoreductase RutF